MKHSEYSVIIVGSGVAGLYAALKISSQISLPNGILIVTKYRLGTSSSKYAQGGIVGVIHQNPDDSTDLHVFDTIQAGAGLSDKSVVKHISEFSDEVVNDLIDDCGVEFDKDDAGALNFTLEAAHSIRRILHVGGDATGRGITEKLCQNVLKDSNITVIENTLAVELLVNSDNECKGIITFNPATNEHEIIYSATTVLATGGFGQVYKYTTNPLCTTGDGIDIAYNAGAEIQDMEFVQFHPTALAIPNNENRFLISEAVRGEGAKLVDSEGNQFMSSYHEKKELAPRDIVTRAIYNEMQKKHTDNMYLDASCIDQSKLLTRFPTISKWCKEFGIDITKQPIPIAPAAHYSMGGIKSTIEGKTSIKNLYAIGEVSSTGLHGANRLASNSLLECVVCAYELADYLSFANLEPPKIIDSSIMEKIELYEVPVNDIEYDIKGLKRNLKKIMWDKVGIVRDASNLESAKVLIESLITDFKRNRKCLNKDEYEYRNLLTVAKLIVTGALQRKESRGAHYRSDYINTCDEAKHIVIVKKREQEVFSYVG